MKMSYPVVGTDTRDWMWSTVAYGARAVNIYAYYPMSTGYEAGGYGLVELDGKVTETGRGRRPDRPRHHGQPGPLPQGPAGQGRDRHPL